MTREARDTLRALVDDDSATESAPVVETAEAALDDVEVAAAFVESGGLDRLRRAVEAADRDGEVRLVRRGRRTLAVLERCRRAAADHFHPAHGTVLGGDEQPRDG